MNVLFQRTPDASLDEEENSPPRTTAPSGTRVPLVENEAGPSSARRPRAPARLSVQQKKMNYLENKTHLFEMAIEKLQQNVQDDTCHQFGMMIASSLREMPAGLTRDRAMLVIQNALVEFKASLQASEPFEVDTDD